VAAGFLTEGGQVDYNVAHEQPWGFLVAAYLWTKSIGAGAYLMLALAAIIGLPLGPLSGGAALIALAFIGLTSVLLVADLTHPERFLYILTKSNFRSWLVWGAYVLMGFGALAAITLIAALLGLVPVPWAILAPGVVLAILAAIYSGFLFGQAEGRDYWQSPLLPVHLFVQAITAGGAIMLLVSPLVGAAPTIQQAFVGALAAGLVAHLALVAADVGMPHANRHVARAVHTLVAGSLRTRFWAGAVLLGIVLPLLALGLTLAVPTMGSLPPAIAALAALAGLLIYEDIWVTAGQSVPMS
jgi:formate-dependent nitrite reductase membrane component NrfD